MKQHIHQLLDKYFEANTSLEEEKVLRAYFRNGPVDPEHEAYLPLFNYFGQQSQETSAKPVESYFEETPIIPIGSQPPQSKFVSIRKWVAGVAAVAVLSFSAYQVMNLQTSSATMVALDESHEAEEALEVTKQALAMLGGQFNNSKQTITESVKNAEKVGIFK